ncbi:MAG TPA: AraC family transcriptional regulator [Cellvibrio sp.]|nr:AraC family transcriptional regulator [Cellvibrio sp.]
MTETSVISNIDFFIRYACIGQLFLLIAYLLHKPYIKQSTLRAQLIPLMLTVGVVAYLLLTAPYSPRPQGFIRSVLLMFTHAMPLFLWLYGKQLFDDGFDLERWPWWAKLALVLLGVFYIYVFLVRGGGGQLQMASHVIAFLFIVHLLVSVISTWRHDLVEQRRIARFWFVLLVGLFFLMLDVVELSNTDVNRHEVFMLVNASICLIGTSITAALLFFHEFSTRSVIRPDIPSEATRYSRLIPQENALAKKLQTFIDDAGYLQSDLTINKLASQLECPEHHLRKLINQSLGHTNFNTFLNHHRIGAARKRLVESSLPVLSIALDLGYGSIASFNRAFKEIVGITPTAYRTAKQSNNESEQS